MAKFFLYIFFIFSGPLFFYGVHQLNAQTSEINSISIEGNKRVSDSAVTNFAQISAGNILMIKT